MATSPLIFGRYFPAESPLHRLGAVWKLPAVLVVMVACFCVKGFLGLGIIACGVAVLYAVARIPLTTALKTAAPLLIFAVLTAILNLFFVTGGETLFSWGPFHITTESLFAAGFFGLRLTVLVFIACLLTLTTPVLAIVKATATLLSPLRRVSVPVDELAMMCGMAIRFLPLFAEEWVTIRQAREARGARMSYNPFKGGLKTVASLIIPLFVSAFRHAETISAAMDARCFDLRRR